MYRRSVIPNVFVPKYYARGKKDVSHCECSRQSILYVLEQLLPDKNISVETIETVLGGAKKCCFKGKVE